MSRPSVISAAWLIVPCLACDLLMVPVVASLGGPPPVLGLVLAFGIVGCVLAQGCLLAAYLAWGDEPFLRRLLTHWKTAAGLYLLWLLGAAVGFGGDDELPLVAANVALGVPLVSIAAQFPLWIVRQWFGWRLVRDDAAVPVMRDPPLAIRDPPLAIRDLMLATIVVAVSLALARLAPADGKDVWPVWAVACTAASAISALTILPAGAMLLGRQPFRRGLIWSSIYAGAWIALVWTIVAALWWFAPTFLAPRVIYVGLSSLIFTFAATVILTATIAHSRGYRLTLRRGVKAEVLRSSSVD